MQKEFRGLTSMDSEVSGSRPPSASSGQAFGKLRAGSGARSFFLIFGVSESGAGATGEQGL